MATVALSDGVLVLPALPTAGAKASVFSNATSAYGNGTAVLASVARGSFVCLGSPALLLGGPGAPTLIGLDTLA
jgi:hypothetical protein